MAFTCSNSTKETPEFIQRGHWIWIIQFVTNIEHSAECCNNVFKVSNKNTGMTLFIVLFEPISQIVLVFPFLTLNKSIPDTSPYCYFHFCLLRWRKWWILKLFSSRKGNVFNKIMISQKHYIVSESRKLSGMTSLINTSHTLLKL